ncbi:MAG: Aldo-keto reductase IolS [Legionellaceae bacterium]
MQLRPLGNTNLMVSPIGLGTVKFGRNEQVKYPHPFEIPNDQTLQNLLSLAQDLGINLLDTAPAYGQSEERLGQLLKNKRHEWIIVTKTGEEFEQGNSYFNFTREHTYMSIERSLKRLNTDYLDLVLIHSDGNDIDIIQKTNIIETLAELKKKGMIRAYGMSTKTITGAKMAIEISDVIMTAYNMLEYQQEKTVIDYAEQYQKGVLIKKALSSGHINTNISLEEQFQFILKESAVSSIIIGTINPIHLKENIVAAKNAMKNIG